MILTLYLTGVEARDGAGSSRRVALPETRSVGLGMGLHI